MEWLDLEYMVEKTPARIDLWIIYLDTFPHTTAEYYVLYGFK